MLIVDDHEGFRDAPCALLEAEGFDVVGEAVDGREALIEAERLRPDVVLLDIQLPPTSTGSPSPTGSPRCAAPPAVVLTSSYEAVTYGARLGLAPSSGLPGQA